MGKVKNDKFKGPWYDNPDPDKVMASGLARSTVIILWVVGIVAAIAIGTWFFRVQSSGVKGEGDSTIQKNSAPNRVAARQEYQNIFEDIQGADERIDVMAAAYKADPTSVNLTNLTGSKTYCISRVRDYNALAKKYLSADFRPESLPTEIDRTNPAFDCKETAK
jgi:hypothetical protein